MSSAHSITRAVNPARAVYLDFPLGHTAGKPHDAHGQFEIMRHTLAAFEAIDRAGDIVDLPFQWSDDDAWKDRVMQPRQATSADTRARDSKHSDDRVERFDTPQYQSAEDAAAADTHCATCVFADQFGQR